MKPYSHPHMSKRQAHNAWITTAVSLTPTGHLEVAMAARTESQCIALLLAAGQNVVNGSDQLNSREVLTSKSDIAGALHVKQDRTCADRDFDNQRQQINASRCKRLSNLA
jgi:hypothetical protein